MDDKTKLFISKAKNVHGNRYVYDKVKYINNITKVKIKCRTHGYFKQIPRNHLSGANCKECGLEAMKNKQKMTKEEFIKKAKIVHGDLYNYDKVIYINNNTPVIINCDTHGEFSQTPNLHIIKKNGCKQCGVAARTNKRRMTTKEFITKANLIHDNYYDYSKTKYVNTRTKVIIICKIHGEFEMIPNYHLKNRINGCYMCRSKGLLENKKSDNKKYYTKYNTASFIEMAKKIHENKYIYDKTEYINTMTNVIITCEKHGDFYQRPSSHILLKCGCPKCGYVNTGDRNSMSKEQFMEKANKLHKNKYDYDKTIYVNNRTAIVITCPEHGDFTQIPSTHLEPCGCPNCAAEKRGNDRRMPLTDFIKRANDTHDNKYDYSKVDYINLQTKVKIKCPKHGYFYQKPAAHVFRGDGCPRCSNCGYSKKAIQWLKCAAEMDNVNIQHAENGGEYILPDINIRVDGYDPDNKTVYEFYGCFFHGCPKCFKAEDRNAMCNKTYGELYKQTMNREHVIKSAGYTIYKIWEHDWDVLINHPIISDIIKRNKLLKTMAIDFLEKSMENEKISLEDILKIKILVKHESIYNINKIITMLAKSAYFNQDITYKYIKQRLKNFIYL